MLSVARSFSQSSPVSVAGPGPSTSSDRLARAAQLLRDLELARLQRTTSITAPIHWLLPPPPRGEGWGEGRLFSSLTPPPPLARAAIHEWLGLAHDDDEPPRRAAPLDRWLPPLSLLVHLARSVLRDPATPSSSLVFWIGAACRPFPQALAHHRPGEASLLERSIFIAPARTDERLWAIDAALRCPASAAVIADASGLNMAATRRLQLAAENSGSLALLARPPHEQRLLSAASTRWLVGPAPSPDSSPRWTARLLRCKGVQPSKDSPNRWTVGHNHETRALHLVPALPDRSHAPEGRPAQPLRGGGRLTA